VDTPEDEHTLDLIRKTLEATRLELAEHHRRVSDRLVGLGGRIDRLEGRLREQFGETIGKRVEAADAVVCANARMLRSIMAHLQIPETGYLDCPDCGVRFETIKARQDHQPCPWLEHADPNGVTGTGQQE